MIVESAMDIFAFLLQGIGYFFAGLFVLVILAIIFGDRKFWEYEAEGYCEACANDKIKIEIKCLKKKGTTLQIKGKFKPEFTGKEIRILLNDYKLTSFPESENDGSQYWLKKSLDIDEPKAGDTLSVELARQKIFTQQLYPD